LARALSGFGAMRRRSSGDKSPGFSPRSGTGAYRDANIPKKCHCDCRHNPMCAACLTSSHLTWEGVRKKFLCNGPAKTQWSRANPRGRNMPTLDELVQRAIDSLNRPLKAPEVAELVDLCTEFQDTEELDRQLEEFMRELQPARRPPGGQTPKAESPTFKLNTKRRIKIE